MFQQAGYDRFVSCQYDRRDSSDNTRTTKEPRTDRTNAGLTRGSPHFIQKVVSLQRCAIYFTLTSLAAFTAVISLWPSGKNLAADGVAGPRGIGVVFVPLSEVGISGGDAGQLNGPLPVVGQDEHLRSLTFAGACDRVGAFARPPQS